jgi:heme-degrading monooxygenase HmoA
VATQVIVRISSAVVPESMVSSYLEYVQNCEIPCYEVANGLIGVSVLQKPFVAYVELMTVSVWRSEEALKRFVKDQLPADRAEADCGTIELSERIYEVVLSRAGKLRGADMRGPEETR